MKRTIIFVAVLLAVLVGGTLTWELAYDDYAEAAKEVVEMADSVELACGQVAELIPMFPTLEASRSRGPMHDSSSALDHNGCRIDLHARDVLLISGDWPHEIVRDRLLADHWQEDIGRAADGPGSTAFAATKDSVACRFSATWTLGNQIDSEPVASEYRFGVGCFRIAAGRRSEW